MHLLRPVLPLALAVLASLALSACGAGESSAPSADGKIVVVASTNVYGNIAQDVGGDLVDVHSVITRADADPHSYEATAQDKLAISKAAVGIENGGGYDDFYGQLAKGTLESSKIVNVSELSGLDTGAGFNEHLWYSLPTMSALADELGKRFTALQPASAQSFATNVAAFKDGLAKVEATLAAVKTSHDGAGVAVTEPVPLYMLQAAGLVNKTLPAFSEAIENGSDVPTTVLRDTVNLMSSRSIAVLAYNEQTEGPQTMEVKQAALAAHVPVVDFRETLPTNKTYLAWMSENANALDQALSTLPASGK